MASAKGVRGVSIRNPEGYVDATAHDAISRVMCSRRQELEAADERMKIVIKTIKNILELSGFDLNSRIDITDKATGRRYR